MERTERKTRVIETYSVLGIDLLCIFVAYGCSMLLRYGSLRGWSFGSIHMTVCILMLLFAMFYHTFMNSSRNFIRRGYYVEFVMVTRFNVVLFAVMTAVLFMAKQTDAMSRLVIGYYVVLSEIMMYGSHLLLKRYLHRHLRSERNQSKLLVIAEAESAVRIVEQMKIRGDVSYRIDGIVLWNNPEALTQIDGYPVLSDRGSVIETVRLRALDEVFISLPNEGRKAIETLIQELEIMGITCHYDVDLLDMDTKVRRVGEFAGYTVVTYSLKDSDYRRSLIKRLMDVAGGLVGMLLTGLMLPWIALAIKIDSPGKVFFKQTRIGRNGRRFTIYKFRSMYQDAELRKAELEAQNEATGAIFKMRNDPRITRVGRFLRKTSLDEFPQFFNVLRGDMSLVGTRPPTESEFERYTPYQKRRLCMTPGLTGLWQVSGRSDIEDFEEVVRLDLEYIDSWSLSLDIKILVQTVFVVLFSRGAR